MRRQPGRPVGTRIRAEDGRVVRVVDPTDESGLTAAPLMAVGPAVAERIAGDLPGPPFELAARVSGNDRRRRACRGDRNREDARLDGPA